MRPTYLRTRATFGILSLILTASPLLAAGSGSIEIKLQLDQTKPISPNLLGIFFEDINYAADGGLYAELVQNRSFEYQPLERRDWHPLSFWELATYDGGKGSLNLDAGRPLHPNNPHYAVLDIGEVGGGVGIRNPGFDGIVVRGGELYDLSLFVRQLYVERRWGGRPFDENSEFALEARLEKPDGTLLGETDLEYKGTDWQQLKGTIQATGNADDARLVVLSKQQGGIAFDVVSLFPRKTFRERAKGLRKDLAETIAAIKPKFVRFPGGCLVHGNGLGNMYRWQDTIGPIHERREQHNIWGYHQTVGLGYFEYFQFCEDIGAEPLPVVPAAVCCQNSGYTAGRGQEGLPMALMPDYIQEVFDLVEWANGPSDSEWGSKRAAAGHPEPFNLKYLGVGNEDHITATFDERFRMIQQALAEKHPEITVIGTVGPFHSGPDYERGWQIARELKLDMVDEHYYERPDWFLSNLQRYDKYDRSQSKVYLGEYAAHDRGRRTTLRTALAEAAYLTHLERNSDLVEFASYAPLLGKRGHTQWNPDLIYFDNTKVAPTINYYVQLLFGVHAGDEYIAASAVGAETEGVVYGSDDKPRLAYSCVRDSDTGDLIVKLVNLVEDVQAVKLQLGEQAKFAPRATCCVLAGTLEEVNDFDDDNPLTPQESQIRISPTTAYRAPPHSLTVLRLPAN